MINRDQLKIAMQNIIDIAEGKPNIATIIYGEINAYTDIKILIETSGVLEKPSKEDLIEMLSPREQIVLKEREKGMSYEEIGKEANITRERVRQIEKIATKKLNALIEKYGVLEDE